MRDTRSSDPSRARVSESDARSVSPSPLVLWRLRGATDELRGLAIETSFGYALGLELDTELVLLHLQPSLESLVAYADRIEAALLAQGWQGLDPRQTGRSPHASRGLVDPIVPRVSGVGGGACSGVPWRRWCSCRHRCTRKARRGRTPSPC